jgi:hypothetical protein
MIEVICDGMPTNYGCPGRIELRRLWTAEGMKPSGWLVTHATEDRAGTPSVPRYLVFFCPSCAPIVLAQEAKP